MYPEKMVKISFYAFKPLISPNKFIGNHVIYDSMSSEGCLAIFGNLRLGTQVLAFLCHAPGKISLH